MPMHNHIRCISSCSVLSLKCKLDLYLRNIVDLLGRPGFNNNLYSVNYKQGWTLHDDLAVEQPEVSKSTQFNSVCHFSTHTNNIKTWL